MVAQIMHFALDYKKSSGILPERIANPAYFLISCRIEIIITAPHSAPPKRPQPFFAALPQ
jgi:hypothetical protein